MRTQAADCAEKFSEEWLSCMVFMVQGNLSAITFSHCVTALKVASSSTLAYAAVHLIEEHDPAWLNILVMGVITAVFDFSIHPTHFGPVWAEAVATGAGTALLGAIVKLLRRQ